MENTVSHFPHKTGRNSQGPVHQHRAMVEMRNSGTVCLGKEKEGTGILSKSFSSLVWQGRDSKLSSCP